MTTFDDEQLWVAKVRRNGGGYSVLDVTTEEKAQALVDEMNTLYQTDNYFVKKYEPKDKYDAHSNHGKS